jgi:hypothetical protein
MTTKSMRFAEGLDLPAEVITQKVAVIAESGAGKTYTAGMIAEGILEIGGQVIILDPVGVWPGLQTSADGKRPGYPIAAMGGDRGNLPLKPEAGELVGRLLAERRTSMILDVSQFTTSETKRFIRDFAEAFFQAKKKNKSPVHIIWEEAQTAAPQMPERDEGVMLNRVERLLKIGRNYGVGWTLVTQQPQAVHKRVLNLAGTVIALRTSGKHERKAIAEWATSKMDPKELDLIGHLPTLKTGQAHVWSPSFLGISKTVKILKKKTLDSSATPEIGSEEVTAKVVAPLDLDELRAAMASVVAEVEQNNPATLRKKIAELERTIAARPSTVETQVESVPVEVPVLKGDDLKRVEGLFQKYDSLSERVISAGEDLSARMDALYDRYEELSTKLVEAGQELTNAVSGLATRVVTITTREVVRPPAPKKSAPRGPVKVRAPAPVATGDLSPYAHLLLSTAAARLPMRPTRSQLAILSGRSTRSSSFDGAMSALLKGGYLVQRGAQLELTGAGLAQVGGTAPAPTTPDQLQATWLGALPRYEADLLRVLLGNPRGLTRDELGAAAGKSTTSSSFDGAISTLKKNELVIDESGALRASEMFFA